MQIRAFSIVASVATCAGFSSIASAQLQSVDWLSPGDGLLTRDTVSGYLWLDLTQTTNISYNDMDAALTNPASNFFGFRRGTSAEVDALFTSAGILTRGTNATPAGIENLLAFNGTLDNTFRRGSDAFTSDLAGFGDWRAITSHFIANPIEPFGSYALAISNGGGSPNYADWAIGHWLVIVPSPSASAVFGLGALAAARRRRP